MFDAIYGCIFGECEGGGECPGYGDHHFLSDDGDSFAGIESFFRKKEGSIQIMVFPNEAKDVAPTPQFYEVSESSFCSSIAGFMDWWEKQMPNKAWDPMPETRQQ